MSDGGVRIADMPFLGAFSDTSSLVGENAGSGRFSAAALRDYFGVSSSNTTAIYGVRNVLHNAVFAVQQRGAGPFGAGVYTADRWIALTGVDAASVLMSLATDLDRVGIGDESAKHKAVITYTGNAAAGSFTTFGQAVEDVTRLAGKTVAISFWARAASGTPKLGVSLDQMFGAGGSPLAAGAGSAVTLTTAWARYAVQRTIPSIGGKTIGPAGDNGTLLRLWLSAGSDRNTASGGVGVQSGTVELWGVQLEVGGAASALEMLDYSDDLRRCQRFYQQVPLDFAMHGGTAGGAVRISSVLPVTMRIVPTPTLTSNASVNVSGLTLSAPGAGSVVANATVTANGAYAITCAAQLSAEFV